MTVAMYYANRYFPSEKHENKMSYRTGKVMVLPKEKFKKKKILKKFEKANDCHCEINLPNPVNKLCRHCCLYQLQLQNKQINYYRLE